MRAAVTIALVLGVLMLAACGKKGPPTPPGPPDEITWPRAYPTR
jgi:hypothetical protein